MSYQHNYPNITWTKMTPVTEKNPGALTLQKQLQATGESWEQERWPSALKTYIQVALHEQFIFKNLYNM